MKPRIYVLAIMMACLGSVPANAKFGIGKYLIPGIGHAIRQIQRIHSQPIITRDLPPVIDINKSCLIQNDTQLKMPIIKGLSDTLHIKSAAKRWCELHKPIPLGALGMADSLDIVDSLQFRMPSIEQIKYIGEYMIAAHVFVDLHSVLGSYPSFDALLVKGDTIAAMAELKKEFPAPRAKYLYGIFLLAGKGVPFDPINGLRLIDEAAKAEDNLAAAFLNAPRFHYLKTPIIPSKKEEEGEKEEETDS